MRGLDLRNDPFYGGSNPLHLGHSEALGWLGEFRRSRETGLWFLGRHGLHMRGNSSNAFSQ